MGRQRLDAGSLQDILARPKVTQVASYATDVSAFMRQDGYVLLHPRASLVSTALPEISYAVEIGRPVVFVTDKGTRKIFLDLYREEAKVPQFPFDMRWRIPKLYPVSGSLAIGMVPPIDPFYGMVVDENEDIGFFASTFHTGTAEFLQGYARNMDPVKWGARETRSYPDLMFEDEFVVASNSPTGPGIYPAYAGEATELMVDLAHNLADIAQQAEERFRLPSGSVHITLVSDHDGDRPTFALFNYIRPVTSQFDKEVDKGIMRSKHILPYLDQQVEAMLEGSAEEEDE